LREMRGGNTEKGMKFQREGFHPVHGERAQEVQNAQEEQGPRPVLIQPEAKRGTASRMGDKPLRRRFKAEEVLEESAGTERKRGNSFSIILEEESTEGQSPNAWGAERGFQGSRS